MPPCRTPCRSRTRPSDKINPRLADGTAGRRIEFRLLVDAGQYHVVPALAPVIGTETVPVVVVKDIVTVLAACEVEMKTVTSWLSAPLLWSCSLAGEIPWLVIRSAGTAELVHLGEEQGRLLQGS